MLGRSPKYHPNVRRTSFLPLLLRASRFVLLWEALKHRWFRWVFQSILMNEGLVEYMTFIRGVVVVSMDMGQKNIGFLFEHMFDQSQIFESELTESPLIDPELARPACRSLERFCPLVKHTREVEFYGHLLSAARALFTSSRDGLSSHFIFDLFPFLYSYPPLQLLTNSSQHIPT